MTPKPKFKQKTILDYQDHKPDVERDGFSFWFIHEMQIKKRQFPIFAYHKPDGGKGFVAYYRGKPFTAAESIDGVSLLVYALALRKGWS